MRRYSDWVLRLSSYINEVRDVPFKRGEHDCALFACNCILKMTGVDIASDFRGMYTDKAGAYKLVLSKGFDDLIGLASSRLRNKQENTSYLGRGDMVVVPCVEGIALGIVDLTGNYAVTTGKNGLVSADKDQWICGWKV